MENNIENQKKREIVNLATSMIEGRTDLVWGCRVMDGLRLDVKESERKVFNPFIAFADDTERFPIEETRNLYSTEYIEKADLEKEKYLQNNRTSIIEACNKLIEYFSK
jgi:hypothetical protein